MTDRKESRINRMMLRRTCRIFMFVWTDQPTTRERIADHLAGTDAEMGRTSSFDYIKAMLEEGMIEYDEHERIITPGRVFRPTSPHRGGVDVFVSEPSGS